MKLFIGYFNWQKHGIPYASFTRFQVMTTWRITPLFHMVLLVYGIKTPTWYLGSCPLQRCSQQLHRKQPILWYGREWYVVLRNKMIKIERSNFSTVKISAKIHSSKYNKSMFETTQSLPRVFFGWICAQHLLGITMVEGGWWFGLQSLPYLLQFCQGLGGFAQHDFWSSRQFGS